MAQYFGRVGILKANSGITSKQMREHGTLGSTHVQVGKGGLLAKSFFGFEKGGRVYGISITIWEADNDRKNGHGKLMGDWSKPPIVNDVELVGFNNFEVDEPAQNPLTKIADDEYEVGR